MRRSPGLFVSQSIPASRGPWISDSFCLSGRGVHFCWCERGCVRIRQFVCSYFRLQRQRWEWREDGEEEKSRKWMSYLRLSLPVHITWYFYCCFLQGFIFVWMNFSETKYAQKNVEFIFEEGNDLSIKKKEMWNREAEKWRQWMDYQCLCFLSSIA